MDPSLTPHLSRGAGRGAGGGDPCKLHLQLQRQACHPRGGCSLWLSGLCRLHAKLQKNLASLGCRGALLGGCGLGGQAEAALGAPLALGSTGKGPGPDHRLPGGLKPWVPPDPFLPPPPTSTTGPQPLPCASLWDLVVVSQRRGVLRGAGPACGYSPQAEGRRREGPLGTGRRRPEAEAGGLGQRLRPPLPGIAPLVDESVGGQGP